MQNTNLKGKIVVVTGCCGLLGRQFCKTLKAAGAHVIGVDKHNTYDRDFDDFVNGLHIGDITNERDIERISMKIKYRKIDILINAFGINPQPEDCMGSLEFYPLEKWRKSIDVNLTGVFNCCKNFGKYMQNLDDPGIIINISSDLGLVVPNHNIYDKGRFKPPDYCVSKASVIYMTKYLAGYWKNKIRVNCLVPGGVYNGQDHEFVKRVEKEIPMNRMAKVDEYNKALLFLCSDASKYMQGQTLIMDGGRTL